jgi:hypothetical protein
MVETVGFCQVLRLVMLESAKDQILGVDTLGQHVPPHVRYGTTSLLIRGAMGSMPCLYVSEVAWSFARPHMVQVGPWYYDYPRKP